MIAITSLLVINGDKLRFKGDKLRFKSYKLRLEGDKLRFKSYKSRFKGDLTIKLVPFIILSIIEK